MEDQLWYERLPNMSLARKLQRHLVRFLMALQLVALLPLASCSTAPVDMPTAQQNIQPLLVQLAAEEPDLAPRLIVQHSGNEATIAAAVSALGGQVLSELELIDALVLELPAGQISRLATISGVRWISLDAPVRKSSEPGEDFILVEDFSLMEPGSVRSVNWRWLEIGEEDGMEEGDISLAMFYGGQQEGLRIQGSGKGIETEIDLQSSTMGKMHFSYRRKNFGAADAVRVEISTNGGASWQMLERLSGPVTDANLMTGGFDLSAFAGEVVKLRFVGDEGMSSAARFYLDYVEVAYNNVQPVFSHDVHLPYVTSAKPNTAQMARSAMVFNVGSIVNVRDEFNTVSYQNDDGLVAWKGPWIEEDPYGYPGADGGDYVGVHNGRLQFHNIYRNYESASRSVDLSHGQNAVLSFDWETKGLDANELLSVLISTSAAGPFVLLTTLGGTSAGVYNVDISSYISDDTTIRFANRNYNWEWGEFAFIDNVEIQWVAVDADNTQPPVTVCLDCIDTSSLQTVFPQAIGASDIWNDETRKQGQGITVAVVDSGIAVHPDLTDKNGDSRILAHVDFTTDAAVDGRIDDYYGHGTHVAGAIAGNGKKSYGSYLGVAPLANLVDVRVTDDYGIGTTSGVVAGLQWILENKDTYNIRVVNMSLNSTVAESYHTSALNAAVEILWFNGIVVVVSSGNNGDNEDAGILYPPANDPFVITVGASDDQSTPGVEDDTLAPFTAFGFSSDRFLKPEIIAPGTDIIAALASDDANLAVGHPDHLVSNASGLYYFRMSGTSMASAVAAGTVALLLSAEPMLTPDQVKHRLIFTGRSFSEEMSSFSCDLKVYTDQLAVGWTTAVNNATAIPNAQGLAITYNAPGAVLFLEADRVLNTDQFNSIRFLAYGSAQSNTLKITTYDANGVMNSTLPYWKFLPPNRWTEVVIPLENLGNVSAIKRIAIQDGANAQQATFTIKDVSIAAPCNGVSYLDIKAATQTSTLDAANQNVMPHQVLAKMALIAYWASQNGGETIDWSSVNWNSVNWNSVNWNSVNWNSVNWNSVNWNSVNWNSVNWNSVNWNSVNWNSVNWNSVNWNSVNWNSVNWNSIKRNSVYWGE